MALRCLLVDDSRAFLDAASVLLGRQGLEIVGTALNKSEALERVRELEPDLTIIDLELGGESGFDLAWDLAAASDGAARRTLLTSARAELEFSEVVAVTPSLGFIPKIRLSAAAIADVLADRDHGGGFRHEAILYSSSEELAGATLPFMREGLALGEELLVILRDERTRTLQRALGNEAERMAVEDVDAWYQSPDHALESYRRTIGDRLAGGTPRVRVVAEVVWPQTAATAEVAAWKRYEATITEVMASVPVSIVCAYNTTELEPGLVADARRTHPILRGLDGARPSAQYTKPGEFVHSLEPAGLCC